MFFEVARELLIVVYEKLILLSRKTVLETIQGLTNLHTVETASKTQRLHCFLLVNFPAIFSSESCRPKTGLGFACPSRYFPKLAFKIDLGVKYLFFFSETRVSEIDF